MHYHTIIIGAGAAGLFAAMQIGKMNKKVLLLERNEKAGRKLLVAGSGQCNFTHSGDIEEFLNRYGDNAKFLKKSLTEFTNRDCIHFFDQIGVSAETRASGKVFPKSAKSETVVNALLRECQKNNVIIKYGKQVEDISLHDDLFTVTTNRGKTYISSHVVVATGGQSYKVLGSDGSGYKLASKFNHQIVEPRPGLTYVVAKEDHFKEISGISFENAQMTIWRENKKIVEREGSLLFTHKGVSGPLVLDASRWMYSGDKLTFNFMYPQSFEQIRKKFADEIPERGSEQMITYLKHYELPKSFVSAIFKTADIDPHITCAKISKAQRNLLVDLLTRCPLTIKNLGDFNVAMVTVGGVRLKEINPTTMESRKQKGLYFIGEVLDIDGDTGGYNIQAAFSMAYICAKHINKNK